MCGICGKYSLADNRPIDRDLIHRMCEVIRHRGPDSEGIYIGESVGLGARRLSVIDLQSGDQPIHNEDKTIWIVLNGEIYNFRIIRAELERKGHVFYTQSDTEVIIHLYEEYGTECVNYLRGMFAFAIWDANSQRLMLARDRIGKKPLCYSIANGSMIFASEIKSILQDPSIKRELDYEALSLYLAYQYVPSPHTIFKGIQKLPPAHILVCEKGELWIRQYWKLSYANQLSLTENECYEQIRTLLEEATLLRLESDVPLGALLSGGLDSSVIVGMMSKHLNKPVETFTIGFEEPEYDEQAYARASARHFKTNHHEFIVRPEALDILPTLVWHFGEPFADKSAVPTYYVSKIAREFVTVALTGDGGDESFGGYDRYWGVIQHQERISRVLRNPASIALINRLASRFKSVDLIQRARSFLSLERTYLKTVTSAFFSGGKRKYLFKDQSLNSGMQFDPAEYLLGAFSRVDSNEFIERLMGADILSYLPDDLQVKMDVMSMANSLEARSPFLDHHLMEFAARIPIALKLKGPKYLLKMAMRDILPIETIHRKKKGFSIPVGRWLRYQYQDSTRCLLTSKNSVCLEIFDLPGIRLLLDDHFSGKADHGYRIWALLNFELWHRMFINNGNLCNPSLVLEDYLADCVRQ